MSETEIQREILEYLNSLPRTVAWRNNTGRRGNVKFGLCAGSSDIICCHYGRFVAIEVKTEEGKVSDEQWAFMATVINADGTAFVAYNLSDVKEWVYEQSQ